MLRFHAVCLILASTLNSCATQPPRAADMESLIGTWKLTGEVPTGAKIPTLSVKRDGSVGGTSGVNRYQARLDTAAMAQGDFRLGPTAGTRMMGASAAMQLESSFLQALQQADQAVIEEGMLVLRQGQRPLLRFERVTAG